MLDTELPRVVTARGPVPVMICAVFVHAWNSTPIYEFMRMSEHTMMRVFAVAIVGYEC